MKTLLIVLAACLSGCEQPGETVIKTRTYYVGVNPDIEKEAKELNAETAKLWEKAYAQYITLDPEKRQEAVKMNELWEQYAWSSGYREAIDTLVFRMSLDRASRGEKAMERMRAEREKAP